MNERQEVDQCKLEIQATSRFREGIPSIVDEIVSSCETGGCFDHVGPEPIPSRDAVIEIVNQALRILFPGYFIRSRLDRVNLRYYLGQEATSFFDALAEQVTLAMRHECLRHNLACVRCEEMGHEASFRFMQQVPAMRMVLASDVRAALQGDPAAKSYDEIIFSYPGLFAVSVHRVAHQLFDQKVSLIPRIMSEYAHSLTGIDIHPGAHIGGSFFIDHGTGVVIGETTMIGERVRLYQGVTLGALSLPPDAGERLRNQKRHPTVEDDVIIYAGATVLGGDTVIGARSVIGGNVWITESVPPDTKVFLKTPELVYRGVKRDP